MKHIEDNEIATKILWGQIFSVKWEDGSMEIYTWKKKEKERRKVFRNKNELIQCKVMPGCLPDFLIY